MAGRLVIALAQLNPTVGDVRGNLALLREARAEAARQGADIVIASELVLCGYPPEDLVLRPCFLKAIDEAVEALAADTANGGPAILVGAPWTAPGATAAAHPDLDNPVAGLATGRLYNAALLLQGGRVAGVRCKHDLPNYGVFDEKRLFAAGPLPGPIRFKGVGLGVMICEDMWFPDVSECLDESGADLLIAINGSPWDTGKLDERLGQAVARVAECRLPLIYVHQVGGQDELVFDGASFALNRDGTLAAQLPGFESALATTVWEDGPQGWSCVDAPFEKPAEGLEATYRAMTVGLRDYVDKNRFPGVVLGLSGGVDSALSAAAAVDALGADRVHGVMMPSPYTHSESLEDAAEAARLLGMRLDTIGIEPAMAAFETMLTPVFNDAAPDVTEENIQSRLRGLGLMAISNKLGSMVLTTGNKSEMSVGYATLYGDMCGGYSVLKDVYKTQVFALARWRNRTKPAGMLGPDGRVMPERTIEKPPSAELRPDQKDEDSLPPYETLDSILERLIERDFGIDEVVADGYDREMAVRVWRMLELAEYKRRQAPPGVKVTLRNLSRERRYPITNAFKGPV